MSKNIALLSFSEGGGYAAAKSLNAAGYQVYVIDWQQNNSGKSTYVKESCYFETNATQVTSFYEYLRGIIIAKNIQLLFPVHDAALQFCIRYIDDLRPIVELVNCDLSTRILMNKLESRNLCEKHQIPTPKTIHIDSLEKYTTEKSQLVFPLIAKTCNSAIINENHFLDFKVRKITNEPELHNYIREHINTIEILLQEDLGAGYGIGVNILCKNGIIKNLYIHKRIEEAQWGGVSNLRETIDPKEYNDLIAKIKNITKELNFTGIAMFEFRVCNAIPYFMEVNPRLWGSIQLGISAGYNFPVQSLPENLGNLAAVEPDFHYLRVRNLRNNIIQGILRVLRDRNFNLFFVFVSNLRGVFSSKEIVEDSLFNDIWYKLHYFISPVVAIKRKLKSKIKFRFLRIVRREYKYENGDCLVFVCKGNIIRSAFSEAYVQKNYPMVPVQSIGFIPMLHRLPPVKALVAAQSLGIDISNHHSADISSVKELQRCKFIVMDRINYFDLIDSGISKEKIYFLNKNEISDPYFHQDTISVIYKEIQRAIDKIFTP